MIYSDFKYKLTPEEKEELTKVSEDLKVKYNREHKSLFNKCRVVVEEMIEMEHEAIDIIDRDGRWIKDRWREDNGGDEEKRMIKNVDRLLKEEEVKFENSYANKTPIQRAFDIYVHENQFECPATWNAKEIRDHLTKSWDQADNKTKLRYMLIEKLEKEKKLYLAKMKVLADETSRAAAKSK